MRTISIIAINTFRETIRNKVLYNVLLFAGIIICLSVSFGKWSVFARIQVMEDFGLATMSISGLLLAVFIGVAMLGKEINNKTVYLMASKPIKRSFIIIGKYLGLLTTLLLNYFIMTLFLYSSLLFIGGKIDYTINYAIILTMCEMAIIVSVALFFSIITTSTLSAILTIAFYILGHFNDLVDINQPGLLNGLLVIFLKAIHYLLPSLGYFNIRTPVVYNLPVSLEYVFYTILYGLLYTILFICISCLLFEKKDL
jgi:ABC-type transport system involved in multi-copper enzyme maturation permease subunit